jgi:magnesium-transporting ATPase (P-type)
LKFQSIHLLFTYYVTCFGNIEELGSLAYLPHAGRVLPVIFFGWQAIPAILVAEFLEWEFLWQGSEFFRTAAATTISTMALIVTWFIFHMLDVDLKESGVLKNTNWKHVSLFILVASLLNGIGNGAWYAYILDDTDALISVRFMVGDVVGATIMLILLVVFYPMFKNFQR